MASTGLNVLRWSALGGGIVYGIYHQSSIRAADKVAEAKHEYARQEKLIRDAKTAYAKKTQPAPPSSGLITDPENPNFDLEKFLKAKENEV